MKWLALALVGCDVQSDPRQGTAVGNPGDADVKVSEVPEDLELISVVAPTREFALQACDGTVTTLDLYGGELDGLNPSPAKVPFPAGTWCQVELSFDGPIEVSGITAAGTAFTVGLELGLLGESGPFAIDGDHLLLTFPVPLDAADLDARGDGAVLAADDPLAVAWAIEARSGGEAWLDGGDGVLGPDDTLLGKQHPADTAAAAEAALESAGCGCAHSDVGVGPWVGLAALAWARRRRMRVVQARSGE